MQNKTFCVVWCMGKGCTYAVSPDVCGIAPGSRCLYSEHYLNELKEHKPRMIAYGNRELPVDVTNYLLENYEVVAEIDRHKVCVLKEGR